MKITRFEFYIVMLILLGGMYFIYDKVMGIYNTLKVLFGV